MVNALARSPSDPEILAAPGNPGIAEVARCLPGLDPTDVPAVVEAARENEVELVVVGPVCSMVAGSMLRPKSDSILATAAIVQIASGPSS
ncbi:MAG: hypothetical protein ACKOL0_03065 [Solirubrobacterales bacterium]